MSMIFQPDYQIAVGNNNTAGLVAIESITPAGDTRNFQPVRAFWDYDPGVRKVRADGTDYFAGYAVHGWTCAVLTKLQWQYLKDTYCNGGYSGAVTIRTRFGQPNTYANFNAVLRIPKESETGQAGPFYRDVRLLFTRLVAL